MKKGFTLIELLVAVSIIAVLSAVGITTFSGIQGKARDTVRKNDLNTLATALALYQETNGEYLLNTGSCVGGPAPADTLYTDPNFKKFISGDLPADPKTKNHYCYETDAKGLTYKLYAKLDDGTDYILSSEDYIAQALPTPTPGPTSTPAPTIVISTPTAAPIPTPTPIPTLTPTPQICYDINRIDDFPPTYYGETIRLKPVVDWTKAARVVMQYYEYPRPLAPPETPFIASKWLPVPGGTITSSTGEVSWTTPPYPGDWWIGMVVYDAGGNKIASWDSGNTTDCTRIVRLRPFTQTCGETSDDGERISTEPVVPINVKVYTSNNNVVLKWNVQNSDGPNNDQFEAQRSLQASFTPRFPPAVSRFSPDYSCYWDEDGQQICSYQATDLSSSGFSAGSYFYKIASFREGGELDLTKQMVSPKIITVNLPLDSSQCNPTIYGPPTSSNFDTSFGSFRWEYNAYFTNLSGWYLHGPNGLRFDIPVIKVYTTSNCRGINGLVCAILAPPYPLPSGTYYIQSYKLGCGAQLGNSSNSAYLSSTQTTYSPPTSTATSGSGSAGGQKAYISANWQANPPTRTCNAFTDYGNCYNFANDYNPGGYHLYRSSTPFDSGAAEVLNSGSNFSSYDRYAYFPNLSTGAHYFSIKAANSCGEGWSNILKVDLPSGTVSGIQTDFWSVLKTFIQKFLPF